MDATLGSARGLRRSAAGSLLAVGLVLAAVAAGVAEALQLGAMYVVRVLAGFAVVGLLVLAHLPAHRPFVRFGAANQVTLCRAAAVALLAGLVGAGSGPALGALACAIGAVAAVLDAVDGRMARAKAMASEFGARFDMETDAALILVLAVLAWQLGKAGPWVLAAGLARYLFVAAGARWTWLRRPLAPSLRRKAAAAVQMAVLVVVLAPAVPPALGATLAASGLAFLLVSFAVDVRWLRRHALAGLC